MADASDDATDPAAVSVGTTVVTVLAGTAGRRRAFVIQNNHASNDLYLGFGANGANVTIASGIRLKAGDLYTDSGDGCYSGTVSAVASASGTDVRVVAY